MTTTGVSGEPDPREAAEEAVDLGYRRFDCTGDDPADTAEACEAARLAIKDGECIVLPTDTVYGIGADAFSAEAVQRLLDAKNRGRDMPPPVLISEAALIRTLAIDVPESAHVLVDKHWPGALTVICRIQPSLRMDLGDTNGTIALRVPDHELARDILRRTGPMAVSSANISGQPAALTCDEAIEQLGDSVSVYLDGGPLGGSGGAPSTIVDFTQHDDGHVLRRGGISVEMLRETVPNLRDMSDDPEIRGDKPSTSSGPIGEGSEPSADADSGPTDEGSAPSVDEGSAPSAGEGPAPSAGEGPAPSAGEDPAPSADESSQPTEEGSGPTHDGSESINQSSGPVVEGSERTDEPAAGG